MAHEEDNSSDLAVLGFFAGGFIGYLLRPSYPYLHIGQLPFGFGTILLNRRLHHFAIPLREFHHTNMVFSRMLL